MFNELQGLQSHCGNLPFLIEFEITHGKLNLFFAQLKRKEELTMQLRTHTQNGINIAVAESETPLIVDAASALDLLATVRYETDCDHLVLYQAAVTEEFFRLSSGLAGEVLQKFVNYRMKLAIIGDYSHYTSKPLKDFIYESNKGRDIFFVATEAEAFEKLAAAGR